MRRNRHKRKKNHVVIVTSDAVDADVRQFRLQHRGLQVIILTLCVVIGAMIGYIAYEGRIWNAVDERNKDQLSRILVLESDKSTLEEEKLSLETEIAGLHETVLILSETVNQKTKSESELADQLERQSLPTEFPLTGSASMEEGEDETKPICIFTASVGTTVIATASGTVTAVNDDVEYGHNVWVDHGNGYVTIYRNGADASVKLGDSVVNGTTLFVIGDGFEKLGYQMMLDGSYINPMEMLSISG